MCRSTIGEAFATCLWLFLSKIALSIQKKKSSAKVSELWLSKQFYASFPRPMHDVISKYFPIPDRSLNVQDINIMTKEIRDMVS
jgi:hypothetical protein